MVYDGTIVMTDYHEECVGYSVDCLKTVYEAALFHLVSELEHLSYLIFSNHVYSYTGRHELT